MRISLTFVTTLLLAGLLIGCGRPSVDRSAPAETPLAGRASSANLPPEAFPTARPPATPGLTAKGAPTPPMLAQAEPKEAPSAAAASEVAPADRLVPQKALDPDLAATVNGVPITRETFELQLSQAQRFLFQQPALSADDESGQQALAELKSQVLSWLIDQMLLEQAAAQADVQITEAGIEDQVQRMRGDDAQRFQEWLTANGLTLQELKEQVRADLLTAVMRDRVTASIPRASEHIHVRHILLSEEVTAREVKRKLESGENFIALAREYSEDQSTRGSGGDLGFIPRGVMPPEFDAVAFALAPGEISEIVESLSGFQLIQVVEIDPMRTVTDQHWPMVQQAAFEAWMAEQRSAADIVSMQF